MDVLIHPITIVTFLPLVGFVVILFMKGTQKNAIRWTALLASLATFGAALWILTLFDPGGENPSLRHDMYWFSLGDLPVNFEMRLDGLNILLVLLTAFLSPLTILSTWKAVEDRVKGFMLFFLMLETGMMGVFLSMDLVLFYLFWEVTLIPMVLLIGMWGSGERVKAAIKFFLFTLAGSILMLAAILYIGWKANTFSLEWLMLNRQVLAGAELWLFLGFAVAFAIKVPMFPLHSWLPDAHTEAPTAGSVILAGVLLKMGTYGFLRFNLGLFPELSLRAAPWIAGVAVFGILYGAVVAFAQKDVKRLVAYSSISHLGFVMLGLFALNPEGIAGAILQMVNHGLSTGALFLIVGMLYERRHTREMEAFGGLWKAVPMLGALMLIVTLSSIGLPGLNGFIGEFTILVGAFGAPSLGTPLFAGMAASGVILAAVYLLTMFQKVFLGPIRHEENQHLEDISNREFAILLPLLVLIFWIGLYPAPFFNLINPAVEQLTALLRMVP